MNATKVERFYRDVRVLRIYEGTSQIQQVIIARAMPGKAGLRRLEFSVRVAPAHIVGYP